MKRCAFIFFILSAILGALAPSSAEDRKPTEYEVKAAFIYNFAKFVDWPAGKTQDSATINVCVVGDDPFGPALAAIEGKTVADRKIHVKRNPSPPDVKNCGILFISGSEDERLERILADLSGSPVLTIGDTKGFAQRGVMMNFYLEDRTVRFAINPKAAGRAGLKISSNLLRIAKVVGDP